MDLQALIFEGASLKQSIDAQTARLREINKILQDCAEFGDRKTAHLMASNIKVTVQRKENVKWDQKKLIQIAGFFPEDFKTLFSIEYKPNGKKISNVLQTRTELSDAIKYCREVSEGAPHVTYERIEDA